MKTILAFGETLWDLLPDGPVLGGAPANFAYRVKSLGDRAILATRLGRDELGKKAFERLGDLGLELRWVQWDEKKPTGTVPVKIDANGVPDFTILPDVAYDTIEPKDALLDVAGEADAVCFGTLIQRSFESRRALNRVLAAAPRALKFLDVNLRKDCFSRESVESSIRRSDIVKLNEEELRWLVRALRLRDKTLPGAAREVVQVYSLDACVVTLGERGVLAVSPSEKVELPGWKVPVVDTVGSGDAFSAAFLALWLRGRSLKTCCEIGNALGAMVARSKGATQPISIAELSQFCGKSVEALLAQRPAKVRR